MSIPHTKLSSRRRPWAAAAFLLVVWSIASCGGAASDIAGPPTGGQIATLVVTPSASSLPVGAALPLQASTQDASGQLVGGTSIFWSSSDTTVAIVSSSGVVTARAVGTVQIAASAAGRSALATISVVPVPVASVAVVPGAATVSVSSSMTLTAVAYDATGGSLSGRQVVWASSAPQVARVDARGTVTGVAAGTASITATSEGKSGTAAITVALIPVASVAVSPGSLTLTVGQAAALAAVATDANGNTLPGRGLAWSSGDTAVAKVAASGLVTAVGAGMTSITATSEGHSASAQVAVGTPPPGSPPPPAAIASIILAPASAAVTVGGGFVLAATITDARGNVLTGRMITWSSSAPQVASVNGEGSVTGVAPGTATITAASEGKTATATVTVSAPPPPPPVAVTSVTVTPGNATVLVGGSVMLAAATRDGDGNVLYGRSVSWATSVPSIATVSGSGVVTAVAAGTATITATSEGHSGGAQITVNAPPPSPVATVTVTPPTATLTPGGSVILAAATYDASHSQLTGRTVTWLSSAPQIARVDGASGQVTAVAPGSATITATSEGKSGTAQVTVNPPPPAPVASVTVAPATATVTAGDTVALSVTTRDSAGNALPGRAVTWASSNASVATVSASGVVKAIAAGSATVTATSEGKSGTASITVPQPPPPPPAPVARIVVTPASATMPAVGHADLTATVYDANGNQLTGRTITWRSSDTTTASVTATGASTATVSGRAAGTATITATSEGQHVDVVITVGA